MRKLTALFLCTALLCSCSSSPKNSPSAAPADDTTTFSAMASPTQAPTGGPYEGIAVSMTIGAPVDAERVDEPSLLELDAPVAIKPRYDLVGDARGLAVMNGGGYAFVGKDSAGNDCLYGGDLYSGDAPLAPLYIAGGEYPHIGSVTGSKHCAYFVEYNDAVWRLLLLNLNAAPNESDAPQLIDDGEGPPPQLVSSDGEMVYAVENAQGYELRVLKRKGEDDALTERLGIITLPQDTLEPQRSYRMNAMGATHVERVDGGYLAIAENLEGIQAAIASAEPLYSAQIGSYAVAWLSEDGAFCAYDPEANTAYRYGEGIEWYAPRDAYGEGVGYLFGGKGGLYMMSWNLDSDPLEMSVYALAEGDGWEYHACAVEVADKSTAYVLRSKENAWQLAYVVLNEAFG